MPKYIVKDTHIRHGVGKEAKVYGPGDELELTAEEAKKLGGSVEPASQAPADKVLTRELSAEEAIERIREAGSLEELKAVSLKDDERVTVKDAYKARKDELKG